ncbi:hypothetical protein BJX64DRAFT_283246 [Aspergillus heterothallicus]
MSALQLNQTAPRGFSTTSFNSTRSISNHSGQTTKYHPGHGHEARPSRNSVNNHGQSRSPRTFAEWKAFVRRGHAYMRQKQAHRSYIHKNNNNTTRADHPTSRPAGHPAQKSHLNYDNKPPRFARHNPPPVPKRGVDLDGDCQMTGMPFIYSRADWFRIQREVREREFEKKEQIARDPDTTMLDAQ